jgi:acyl-CoA synthetase (AMP-forming)/AMP-acid ligase II
MQAKENLMMNLTQMLNSAATETPNTISTRFGDRTRTWSETRDRVSRMAHALKELGVGDGDRVAILALNSDRYTEYYFSVWWAGAVVVPMNVRWSAAENAYSMGDAGAKVLFVDAAFAPMVPAIKAETKSPATVIYLDDTDVPSDMLDYEELIASNDPIEDAYRGGEDLAGLYYTGGTTGFPKGVMLPHRSIWYNSLAVAKHAGFEHDDVYLHAAPMFHLADGASSNGASIVGATHAYIPTFDVEAALAAIETHEVTHCLMVPTMIGMLLHHSDFRAERLQSLRSMMYGASPMPQGLLREALEKLPHVDFIQAYGQTEMGPIVTMLPASYHTLEGPKSTKLRSAGRVVVGCEVRIVGEDGRDQPVGEVGEIVTRSPGCMLGYWNLPEQTESTLIDGWVHTGDGAYRDEDGFLFIVDRLKDMIVTGGENVFSAEVESAISTHPAVSEVAVVGIPSEKWGEAVHAIIVPHEGEEVGEAEIIDHCKGLIANYKLPRSITIRRETLPLSGAGKILKRDLRAPFWEGRDRNVS